MRLRGGARTCGDARAAARTIRAADCSQSMNSCSAVGYA